LDLGMSGVLCVLSLLRVLRQLLIQLSGGAEC
jgi:hypothetical protein